MKIKNSGIRNLSRDEETGLLLMCQNSIVLSSNVFLNFEFVVKTISKVAT